MRQNGPMGRLAAHRYRRAKVAELTRPARAVKSQDLRPGETPVFVTVRDRLSPLADLVTRLESLSGVRIYLVDNDSTYPPLLDYLSRSRHSVVRLGANLGARAAWITGLVQELGYDRNYVVTDPDVVPDEGCPDDFLDHFACLLDRYPDVGRVGFGLRLDDLPGELRRTQDVRTWESQFWETEREPGVYIADIDTTFALYRAGQPVRGSLALRTGSPYVARHLAWYDDPDDPDEEERYYRDHADRTINSWNDSVLPPHLEDLISRRER